MRFSKLRAIFYHHHALFFILLSLAGWHDVEVLHAFCAKDVVEWVIKVGFF